MGDDDFLHYVRRIFLRPSHRDRPEGEQIYDLALRDVHHHLMLFTLTHLTFSSHHMELVTTYIAESVERTYDGMIDLKASTLQTWMRPMMESRDLTALTESFSAISEGMPKKRL